MGGQGPEQAQAHQQIDRRGCSRPAAIPLLPGSHVRWHRTRVELSPIDTLDNASALLFDKNFLATLRHVGPAYDEKNGNGNNEESRAGGAGDKDAQVAA